MTKHTTRFLALIPILGILIAAGGCGSTNTANNEKTKSKNTAKASPQAKTSQPKSTPKSKSKATAKTTSQAKTKTNKPKDGKKGKKTMTEQLATFGGGCFWCVEAVFEELDGVLSVESGYSGGHVVNPTYEQVCGKKTGHAEVCRIKYDSSKITFAELLEVFWKTHNPTTPNQQGNDKGPQYRSVIYYHDDEQKKLAQEYKTKLDKSGAFPAPIVTEISKLKNYYPAEAYHQDYYRLNPAAGYCAAIIRPKMDKFRKVFQAKLKKN